jgi:hypothetical protein
MEYLYRNIVKCQQVFLLKLPPLNPEARQSSKLRSNAFNLPRYSADVFLGCGVLTFFFGVRAYKPSKKETKSAGQCQQENS